MNNTDTSSRNLATALREFQVGSTLFPMRPPNSSSHRQQLLPVRFLRARERAFVRACTGLLVPLHLRWSQVPVVEPVDFLMSVLSGFWPFFLPFRLFGRHDACRSSGSGVVRYIRRWLPCLCAGRASNTWLPMPHPTNRGRAGAAKALRPSDLWCERLALVRDTPHLKRTVSALLQHWGPYVSDFSLKRYNKVSLAPHVSPFVVCAIRPVVAAILQSLAPIVSLLEGKLPKLMALDLSGT